MGILQNIVADMKLGRLSEKIITNGCLYGSLLTKPPVNYDLDIFSTVKALVGAFIKDKNLVWAGDCEISRRFVNSSNIRIII